MDELAAAAGLSKQGLYLHFPSKEEVFVQAIRKYLDDALAAVQAEVTKPGASLYERLLGAMDAWFGRHLATFTPESFDIIEAGQTLSAEAIEQYKVAFQTKSARALAEAPEFKRGRNVCTPKEIAQVLFLFGLGWKEGRPSRGEFMKKVGLCIRACCQLP